MSLSAECEQVGGKGEGLRILHVLEDGAVIKCEKLKTLFHEYNKCKPLLLAFQALLLPLGQRFKGFTAGGSCTVVRT